MKTSRSQEFEAWLSSEDAKTQALVEGRIYRIENYDHFGDAKYLDDGLSELKWKSGLRVYFARVGNRVVLLLMEDVKMTKRVTLKNRAFSWNDIPKRKLKRNAKVVSASSSARLKDRELIFQALWQCLVEQDTDSFKEVLRSHLDVMNKRNFAKRSTISRRTLHRILSKDGNPTLENISKVIHALYA